MIYTHKSWPTPPGYFCYAVIDSAPGSDIESWAVQHGGSLRRDHVHYVLIPHGHFPTFISLFGNWVAHVAD